VNWPNGWSDFFWGAATSLRGAGRPQWCCSYEHICEDCDHHHGARRADCKVQRERRSNASRRIPRERHFMPAGSNMAAEQRLLFRWCRRLSAAPLRFTSRWLLSPLLNMPHASPCFAPCVALFCFGARLALNFRACFAAHSQCFAQPVACLSSNNEILIQ
jgi:hypothetical protein